MRMNIYEKHSDFIGVVNFLQVGGLGKKVNVNLRNQLG